MNYLASKSTPSARSKPRIFYRAWSHNRPTGGQKQMYRHVDILNSGGFEAYVYHDRDGFRLSWFDNDTRVVGPTEAKSLYRDGDIFVLPEDIGPSISKFFGPKVIFNQNVYYGYGVFGDRPPEHYPYKGEDLLGVITVSAHDAENLAYAFPGTRVFRAFCGIDPGRFTPASLSGKRPVIAAILKGDSGIDVLAVFHMLSARAQEEGSPLKDFEWRFIANNTESEVADLLRQAVLFVFLSSKESFGLLPIEAMASGCLVATLDMEPFREYMPDGCRFHPGDLVQLARWIETVAASRVQGYAGFEELASRCRAVAGRYNLECERGSVLSIWRQLLS